MVQLSRCPEENVRSQQFHSDKKLSLGRMVEDGTFENAGAMLDEAD